MISVVVAAAILLSDAAPAAATAPIPAVATTPAAAPVSASGAKVDRDTVVCHMEPVLGSRIPTKVCTTKAQAEDRAQQQQMDLQRMQALSH
jgi:hypothetical protein